MASENLSYRIGDYVYIETSKSEPYAIGKIEMLTQDNKNGKVEVEVTSFIRHHDLPKDAVKKAKKGKMQLETELSNGYQNTLHELFLTIKPKTYSACMLRGKCVVVRMSEVETPKDFVGKEDTFFYRFQLYTDSFQSSQLRKLDQLSTRVGQKYQAIVPPMPLQNPDVEDTRRMEDLETLAYTPCHKLTDQEIDQFTTVVQSVGLFGRVFLPKRSKDTPSLIEAAKCASSDRTIQCAMNALHNADYDLAKAMVSLVPNNNPVVFSNGLEDWTSAEKRLWDCTFEKYGKNFDKIRHNSLPWKSHKELICYYYTWKGIRVQGHTHLYREMKESQSKRKLKQICLPFPRSNENELMDDLATWQECNSCKKMMWCNVVICGPITYELCNSCHRYWLTMTSFRFVN